MINPRDIYIDGAEKFLLKFFSENPETKLQNAINEILKSHPSWPVLYHLSPLRHNILNWYKFKKNPNILEIGAGCGAVTKLFLGQGGQVNALELDSTRAKIIKRRFSDFPNLRVIPANLLNYSPKQQFDYISLIGVLEYSGMFFLKKNDNSDGNDNYSPYVQVIKKCFNLLKPGGSLFVAIENKLGIKYFSGFPEDHYGKGFESIEDYPNYKGVRTFSKKTMFNLAKLGGFDDKKSDLYIPFPDYKLPTQIVHSDFLETNMFSLTNFFPTLDYLLDNQHILNEVLLSYTLQKAGILNNFYNSFLFIFTK